MRKLVAVFVLLVVAGLTTTACDGSPVDVDPCGGSPGDPAFVCPNPTPNS